VWCVRCVVRWLEVEDSLSSIFGSAKILFVELFSRSLEQGLGGHGQWTRRRCMSARQSRTSASLWAFDLALDICSAVD